MIDLDGTLQPMKVRAAPGAIDVFPDLACESLMPAGTSNAAINGQALPLPHQGLSELYAKVGDGMKG
jgi:hypothetical protein